MIVPSSFADCVARFVFPRLRASGPSFADRFLVQRIRATARTLRDLPSAKLESLARALHDSVRRGGRNVDSNQVVQQGFALVNESVRRRLGLECYDVQFLAALALVRGEIAEMATGEGKTLVQALAAFVLALSGKGVHVMTSNAYLADRDFLQLAPVLEQLGLTAGLLRAEAPVPDKVRAYQADITYGAGYEFGFDYLRDQAARHQRSQPRVGDTLRRRLRAEPAPETISLQRGQAVAIVDEADSVMIDEATTPLLLSSDPRGSVEAGLAHVHAAGVATTLLVGTDFAVDERQRSVRLTQCGLEKVLSREMVPTGPKLERPWPVYVEQALVARHFLCRDVDYVVDGDRVVLVDQSTGRIFADRSLREGLHQAVEAREQVPITATRRTRARISRQQFFRLYDTLCGMTGTAWGAKREFREIYRRKVLLIPTRKPCQRITLPTRFFGGKQAKRAAVVTDVRKRYATRQPVLVGTRTIDESIRLAQLFDESGLPLKLLNGRQDRDEAHIIAQAGEPGAVTIATNVAGRGTDIRLGPGVERLGGLHVISTEPHASARVDRQLLGRAARQGDPGSCQMFVSAEDDLIRVFGTCLARTMRRLADARGEIHEDLSREVARLQRRVERMNFEKRRQLLRRDAWLEDVLARLTGHEPES
ncbi:MAG: preprotein translocase subunit SecA [Pirellulaceae bacterium]